MKITALIPARGGSKRIPYKNIKLYANKPLIYWSIALAKQSKHITNIIISTDEKQIANIAQKYGAQVPFIRPKDISQDLSTDYQFIKHYIDWEIDNNCLSDLIVQLRPTYPNRKIDILDNCIEIFINNMNYDSLRTVCEMDKPPYKMYTINNNTLTPLFEQVNDILEPYNKPAQLLPKTYWHNGYIDIIKPSTVLEQNSITGKMIYPYIMDKNEIYDIDTIEEWMESESKFVF